MREGSGLVEFENNYPERFFDVGIAEQHSVTLAAGLQSEGKANCCYLFNISPKSI